MEYILEQFYIPNFTLQQKQDVLVHLSPYLVEENALIASVEQAHLKGIMECYKHTDSSIRMVAVKLIELLFERALLEFDEFIPCVVAMTSDPVREIRRTGRQILDSSEHLIPECVIGQSLVAMKFMYDFQVVLANDPKHLVRGVHMIENRPSMASFLYRYFMSINEGRHAITSNLQFFIRHLLNRIGQSSETDLRYKLFLADNLAYLPFETKDEIFFVFWHIDIIVQQKGTQFLEELRVRWVIPQEQVLEFEQGLQHHDYQLIMNVFENLAQGYEKLLRDYISIHSILLLIKLKEFLFNLFGVELSYSYNPYVKNPAYVKKLVRTEKQVEFNPLQTIKFLKHFPRQSDAPSEKL